MNKSKAKVKSTGLRSSPYSTGILMEALFTRRRTQKPIHAAFLCLHHSMPRGIKAFLFVAMETFYPLHFLLSLVFFVLVHLSEAGLWLYSPLITGLKELMNSETPSKPSWDLGLNLGSKENSIAKW